jgi:hypothetical protein
MNSMIALRSAMLAVCLGTLSAVFASASAATLLTGVNVPNGTRADPTERAAVINQLKAAGVKIVRFGLTPNDGDIEYAKQLYTQGIKLNLIANPQYSSDALTRPPYVQDSHMYPSHPLSYADPKLSQTYFESLFEKLDSNGIVLASIELGNEINWSAFNGEFPLPGEGKIFSLDDLYHDPEGQQVAKGFLRYLQILKVLKDVRDHSRLNRNTPIISAGLSPTGRARVLTGNKEDGVSIEATLQFLRANGLDNLVDGYGIHFYPWQKTLEQTDTNLQNNVVAECRADSASGGKPCWITEWGVVNPNVSCPLDDGPRIATIEHMMADFRTLAQQGRVQAVLYYSWNTDPWAKSIDPITIYRCGSITEAGKIALTP